MPKKSVWFYSSSINHIRYFVILLPFWIEIRPRPLPHIYIVCMDCLRNCQQTSGIKKNLKKIISLVVLITIFLEKVSILHRFRIKGGYGQTHRWGDNLVCTTGNMLVFSSSSFLCLLPADTLYKANHFYEFLIRQISL